MKAAREKTRDALDAIDPDLTAFRSRGGKLIVYHGWNDPAIPSLNTVNYYGAVVDKMGESNADSFARLYMVPGMQHCAGGPGPDVFGQSGAWNPDPQLNARSALENWVEKGKAPGIIIASKVSGADPAGPVTMTRPLCPYPQAAQYKGSGDPNRAENFVCAAPKK